MQLNNNYAVMGTIAVLAFGVGLWQLSGVTDDKYTAQTLPPGMHELSSETQRIGSTDFYLQIREDAAVPILLTPNDLMWLDGELQPNNGLVSIPVATFREDILTSQIDEGISVFFTEGSDLVINDNGLQIEFEPEMYTNTFQNDESFRKDLYSGMPGTMKVMQKFIISTTTAYIIHNKYTGTGNGLCGAGEEEIIYLATVGVSGKYITKGYPFYSCMFGPYADGDVLYYEDSEHLLVSNYSSVMYLNYAHPEWGLITIGDINL